MAPSNWRSGPIAITGADGHVGRHLQGRLSLRPNPVRLLGKGDDWTAGLGGAEAVIHLAGTLQPRRPESYRTANLDTVRFLTDGLGDAAVERLVFLSYVGASPSSANPYLEAKGAAEELIRATDIPSTIFRSTFVYGEPDDIGPSFTSYQSRTASAVSVIGNGAQRLAPIHVDDLADMLVAAALDPQAPTGTFDVGGPEVLTLDDLVRRINPTGIRIRHLSGAAARLLARFLPRLTPPLVDVLLADSVPADDAVATAELFGVTLRRFQGPAPASRQGG